MARRKEAVIHCPIAFRSPEGISNVPVDHGISFPVPGSIHGSLLVALFLPHGNVSQGRTGSLAQLQQHETYNNTSEPFLCQAEYFSMNILISPGPASHFTLT